MQLFILFSAMLRAKYEAYILYILQKRFKVSYNTLRSYVKPLFKICFFLLVQNVMPFGTLLAELGIKL